MWLTYAFGSAFLAGITAILAKVGMGKTDSSLATAIRTIVVVIFSWLMVFLVGSQNTITQIGAKSLLFLVLSGLATGASWLCYFRALQLGDVNKVTPIDKSSTVLTMILAVIILHEALTRKMILAMVLILAGTFLMITKKESTGKSKSKSWFLYAVLSAVFASLTSILAKIGITGVESNLGTAIRTCVVHTSRISFHRSPLKTVFSSACPVSQPEHRGSATTGHCSRDRQASLCRSTN
mgnify:CR=1 FL=1